MRAKGTDELEVCLLGQDQRSGHRFERCPGGPRPVRLLARTGKTRSVQSPGAHCKGCRVSLLRLEERKKEKNKKKTYGYMSQKAPYPSTSGAGLRPTLRLFLMAVFLRLSGAAHFPRPPPAMGATSSASSSKLAGVEDAGRVKLSGVGSSTSSIRHSSSSSSSDHSLRGARAEELPGAC